jgi:S1-C subfamily serine protease
LGTSNREKICGLKKRVVLTTSSIRRLGALAVLFTAITRCGAADEWLPLVQLNRIGKASTALVEVKAARGKGSGSAFCIHPSGWFLTNAHVAQGEITLVLNPSLQTEKSYPARIVRSDIDLDLALLRIDGARGLPALSLAATRAWRSRWMWWPSASPSSAARRRAATATRRSASTRGASRPCAARMSA